MQETKKYFYTYRYCYLNNIMLLLFSFLDQTLIVKAIQDIKEGEEILHCYGILKINNFYYIFH